MLRNCTYLAFLLFLALFGSSVAQSVPASPLFETRATWMATVWNLDWPPQGTVATQQKALRDNLARAKSLGLNTVLFQVVAHGEAAYPSENLPWLRWLTGSQGTNPGWDPLAYAVDEAHKLGLELHAWYNVSHVGSESSPPTTANHITKVHPEWIKKAEGGLWLNPGIPEGRAWVLNNVMEIVDNYDVDGVHFDYMRYPSTGFFDDGNTMSRFPNAGTTVADWRRENLNLLAREIYAAVQASKPWVKVGSAPIGAYKNWVGAPPGYWGYDELFQDARRWMADGAMDYIAPQLYFDIGNEPDPGLSYQTQDFAYWLRDWLAHSNGRHVYAGHGTWRESEHVFVAGEIARQIDSTRARGSAGQVHFRNAFINTGILGGRYSLRALPAPMTWKENAVAPGIPTDLDIELETATSTITIRWAKSTASADDPLRRYAVFRRQGAAPGATEASELVAILGPQDTLYAEVFAERPSEPVYYTVAAQSNLGILSEPALAVHTGMTTLATEAPGGQKPLHISMLYPNPVIEEARLQYEVARPAEVHLTLHDVLGRIHYRADYGRQAAGTHDVTLPADKLPAGIYFVVLVADNEQTVRSLTVAH